MTDHATSATGTGAQRRTGFSLGAWVRANSLGLGLAYGLFALFGDAADALGAQHGAFHGVAAISGLLIGAAPFVILRRGVLGPHLGGSTWTAVAAGIGLAAGFVVGFAVAGPPFDFILGVITLGTIGGALQWRVLRSRLPRPGGLLLVSIAAWLSAGVAAGAIAFFAGDAIDAAFGSGITGFVAVTVSIGLVAGAVGGVIEGAAIRDRVHGGSPHAALRDAMLRCAPRHAGFAGHRRAAGHRSSSPTTSGGCCRRRRMRSPSTLAVVHTASPRPTPYPGGWRSSAGGLAGGGGPLAGAVLPRCW